ncbi:MAG: hypothetical protein ACPG49_07335, partial [Chitinophagales bacterium]
MKYNIFSVLFCLLFSATSFAQSANVNTASTSYNTYVSIEKVIGKTESLEKAKQNIDDAVATIKERQAADDPKLKAKLVAKALHYNGAIYAEIAGIENHAANEGALDIVLASIKESMEADAKGTYKDQ